MLSYFFQTSHGDPEDSIKHAGDLGILEFGPVPDDWPKGVEQCNEVSKFEKLSIRLKRINCAGSNGKAKVSGLNGPGFKPQTNICIVIEGCGLKGNPQQHLDLDLTSFDYKIILDTFEINRNSV